MWPRGAGTGAGCVESKGRGEEEKRRTGCVCASALSGSRLLSESREGRAVAVVAEDIECAAVDEEEDEEDEEVEGCEVCVGV